MNRAALCLFNKLCEQISAFGVVISLVPCLSAGIRTKHEAKSIAKNIYNSVDGYLFAVVQ